MRAPLLTACALAAAGAALLLTRRSARAERRSLVLERDLPELDLPRGAELTIVPEAPIRLGDLVALKDDDGDVVLARYRDDLIANVEGLVCVRRAPALGAAG